MNPQEGKMSLDVWLKTTRFAESVKPIKRIFIRENGQTKEISREEWDERFPDREPVYAIVNADEREVFGWNITHNLSKMASEAGIYKHLWRPEELGVKKAEQLIEPLTSGLFLLLNEPDRFKAFNPENGWGNYEGLVEFVRMYLNACKEYPEAEVHICR
jgi:hypothetical protein